MENIHITFSIVTKKHVSTKLFMLSGGGGVGGVGASVTMCCEIHQCHTNPEHRVLLFFSI